MAISLILAQGCTGSHNFPNNTAQIVIHIDQTITFEEETVTIAKLPAKLKSAGATPSTIIRILTQKNTSQMTMKEVSRALASSGYRNFMFTMPRQAEAVKIDKPVK